MLPHNSPNRGDSANNTAPTEPDQQATVQVRKSKGNLLAPNSPQIAWVNNNVTINN